MQTLAAFIKTYGLTMDVEVTSRNPNMEPSPHMTRHFICKIRGRDVDNGGTATHAVFFSQGSGHVKPPTLSEVLDCLASDASDVENANGFEDWASDYGYDPDSRKAEKVYNQCVKARDGLRAFLGAAAYESLLWNTERE